MVKYGRKYILNRFLDLLTPSIKGVNEEDIKICVLTKKTKKNTTEKKPRLKNKTMHLLNSPPEKPLFVRNWIIHRPFAIDGEKSLDFVTQETYVKLNGMFKQDRQTLNVPTNRAFNHDAINLVEDNSEIIDEVNLEVCDRGDTVVCHDGRRTRELGHLLNLEVVDEFYSEVIDEVNELVENESYSIDYENEIILESCDEDDDNANIFEEILETL